VRPAMSLPRTQPLASAHGDVVAGRQGAAQRRGKRRRLRPQLVHGMPARPVEGRIPAHQRLGRRGRVSAPNAEGWREILHQQEMRPEATSTVPRGPARGGQPASHRPPRRIPADLHGRCLNCLSFTHRVATCKLPQRCLRCRGFQHIARDYKQPRHVGSRGLGIARALGRSNRPADLGGSQDHDGARTGTTVPATGGHRQRRRRRRQRRRRRRRSAGATQTTPAFTSIVVEA
jgi:hypothetical protein